MATIPTTSKISMSTDEENRTNYITDLNAKNTYDEIHVGTSTWSPADKKKATAYDQVLPGISAHFQRGSLHLNHHEENITYEPPYA